MKNLKKIRISNVISIVRKNKMLDSSVISYTAYFSYTQDFGAKSDFIVADPKVYKLASKIERMDIVAKSVALHTEFVDNVTNQCLLQINKKLSGRR